MPGRTPVPWIMLILILLAGCDPEVPFNVSILPFIPSGTRTGVLEANFAPIDLPELGWVVPDFPAQEIPLNTVRIPFEIEAPLNAQGIRSAFIEVGFSTSHEPPDLAVAITGSTHLSVYIAPDTAADRFSSEYRVPLGPAEVGAGASTDLQADLAPAQIEALKHGGLLVGVELSETLVTVTNNGTAVYAFTGIQWELTAFRIRGRVAL